MSSILAFWRRQVRELSDLALWKVLARRGTRKVADRQPEVLKAAIERCLGCWSAAKCDQLLAERNYDALETFCPNIMYFRHLEAMKRHAPKANLTGPDA